MLREHKVPLSLTLLGTDRVAKPITLSVLDTQTRPIMDNITPRTLSSFRLGSNVESGGTLSTLAYSPKLNLFVTGGVSSAAVCYDPNGLNWNSAASFATIAICWSPELNIFCSLPPSGTNIRTSANGISWTSRTGQSGSWSSICWAAELGLFCAIGTNNIQTSPDGITWTSRTPPDSRAYTGIIWAAELGLFIASFSASLSTSSIVTSPDGITWTIRTTPSSQSNFTAYSPYLGLAVSILGGNVGGADYITSTDGITWTQRPSLPGGIRSMKWVPWLYAFVICGDSNYIGYSFDGLTWTAGNLSVIGSTMTTAFLLEFNSNSLLILSSSRNQTGVYTLPQPLLAQNGIPTPFNLGGTGVSTIGTSGQYAIVNAGATGLTYTTGPGGGGVSQVGLTGTICNNSRKRGNELVPHNHVQFKQPNHCCRHIHLVNECFPNNHKLNFKWSDKRHKRYCSRRTYRFSAARCSFVLE